MSDIPQVSIHIVTWNSELFLQNCLESLKKQSFQHFRILIVDNNSKDGTLSLLRSNYPQIQVIQNRNNHGFARAHNQAIHFSRSPFILVINPDIIATPTFLQKMHERIQSQQDSGSVGGKLLRFRFAEADLKQVDLSDRIDSAGIQSMRSRRFLDRGQGERDRGQYGQAVEIFGASGAAALYRRQALEDVRYQDEYFDEDFFAYKEDVDLAWRLQLAGWKSWYEPDALAYHYRTASGNVLSERKVISEHRHRAKIINAFSYRNHLLMLNKNESVRNLFFNAPWILSYELKKTLYLLFAQPRVLVQLVQVYRLWPKMRQKRKLLNKQTRISPERLRLLFRNL